MIANSTRLCNNLYRSIKFASGPYNKYKLNIRRSWFSRDNAAGCDARLFWKLVSMQTETPATRDKPRNCTWGYNSKYSRHRVKRVCNIFRGYIHSLRYDDENFQTISLEYGNLKSLHVVMTGPKVVSGESLLKDKYNWILIWLINHFVTWFIKKHNYREQKFYS